MVEDRESRLKVAVGERILWYMKYCIPLVESMSRVDPTETYMCKYNGTTLDQVRISIMLAA